MHLASLNVKPVDTDITFRHQAYVALRQAITQMNIYAVKGPVRLDERQLSQDLGVSRTPIREAMTVLEREGLVQTLPRRGVFVVKKTRKEIVEMIVAWAALESMAARLITLHAGDEEIASLRRLFEGFGADPSDHLNEYSDANLKFHQQLIAAGGNGMIAKLTDDLLIHVRAIRQMTIRDEHRAERSIRDHMAIIEALERRDTERAEALCREHTLGLARHVEEHGDFLD